MLLIGVSVPSIFGAVVTNLTLEELVCLVNDRSPLQVNLEYGTAGPRESVHVDPDALERLTAAELSNWLVPVTNYILAPLGHSRRAQA